ncbi:Oidioi.mRNA.OKI2018_I69.chr2.g6520.t1.cds [Oikopleura dioica]|uniref:Oidioi.mRNA.OKI2018_I69.chr2.g6520.t1.cds n=1 Tax=Oikopleura dioica TaxID=34765 RepID=A0ABN7TA85_OIKDI|nr:Oidioi.mRNA.OKI2018_I69.chr2.g6520.t1.cds [Oikopleura dioica]
MGCGGSKAAQVSLVKVQQIEDRPGASHTDPWAGAKLQTVTQPSEPGKAIPEPRVTTMTTTGNGLKTPCKTPAPKTPGPPPKSPAPQNPFEEPSGSKQPSAVPSKAPSAVPTPVPPKEEQKLSN